MKIIGTKEEIEQLNIVLMDIFYRTTRCCLPFKCQNCVFEKCNHINDISELDRIEIEVIDNENC